jgi:hypothetical protein
MPLRFLGVVLVLVLGCAPSAPSVTEGEEDETAELAPCRDGDPLRQPFFGETHIHTALSFDAWTGSRIRTGPDDAYAFARGKPLGLPPYDGAGYPTRRVSIDRPLDFAMAADHAEFMGAISLCTNPSSEAWDTRMCRIHRGEEQLPVPAVVAPFARVMTLARGMDQICGPNNEWCRRETAAPWRLTQEAAERWNEPCEFTTFVGYEYTYGKGSGQLHRNVVFRNANVTELPLDARTLPEVEDFWAALRRECLDAGTGCDALAIPHSSNVGNGLMFVPDDPGATTQEEQVAKARLRAEMEPLVEMFQYKGDSECRSGLPGVVGAADELCSFEKWHPEDEPLCADDGSNDGAAPCVARQSFVRSALVDGLREADRIGVNPFQFGFIASTDFHNSAAGRVAEYDFVGGGGFADASFEQRFVPPPGMTSFRLPRMNPGGLAGVWAEENSRDSIFDALRRRETFGTSGPRIVPRFFGGWEYPEDLCAQADWVARGYDGGVAMGGELPRAPRGAEAPVFLVSALRDAGVKGHAGLPLERLQVVKGFVDEEGRLHEAVYDVAGGPTGATVDTRTCEASGTGYEGLCKVWRDPDFDASRRAVYYARVLENPSCRWSTWQCNTLPAKGRPEACESLPKTIQERAWTSPIWYSSS